MAHYNFVFNINGCDSCSTGPLTFNINIMNPQPPLSNNIHLSDSVPVNEVHVNLNNDEAKSKHEEVKSSNPVAPAKLEVSIPPETSSVAEPSTMTKPFSTNESPFSPETKNLSALPTAPSVPLKSPLLNPLSPTWHILEVSDTESEFNGIPDLSLICKSPVIRKHSDAFDEEVDDEINNDPSDSIETFYQAPDTADIQEYKARKYF